MPHIQLDIQMQLRSPLIIGGGRSFGTFNETLPFLPGGALRGALADVLLAQSTHRKHADGSPKPDCPFCQQFLIGEEPLFGNLYPSQTGQPTHPLPLTAQTCKGFPGFPSQDSKKRERHGVYDILIRQYWFERALAENWQLPLLRRAHCPKCQGELKPFGGFYGEGEQKYYRARPTVKRISRTAINRQRAVAQDGLLYTLEVLDAENAGNLLMLCGTLQIEEGKQGELVKGLKKIRTIGMGKSRGLGRVHIETSPRDTANQASLVQRLRQFNDAMQQELGFYRKIAQASANETDVFFTIDLLADALLTEKGLPATYLCPDALGLEGEPITLERWWARHQVAGGWFAAANLPRRTELATVMGSVFLYRAPGVALNDLVVRLEKLEAHGIGRERSRGFGQVQVCSPFHLEVA